MNAVSLIGFSYTVYYASADAYAKGSDALVRIYKMECRIEGFFETSFQFYTEI